MDSDLKYFLIDNKNLIKSGDYDTLYKKWTKIAYKYIYISELTEVLLASGIDFLSHLMKIPEACFYGLDIESITIPNNIKIIGEYAFGSSPIKEIIIPDSVEEIQYAAFRQSSLHKLTLSSSVKTIGDEAFYDTPLTDITYYGRAEDWDNMDKGLYNDILDSATIDIKE